MSVRTECFDSFPRIVSVLWSFAEIQEYILIGIQRNVKVTDQNLLHNVTVLGFCNDSRINTHRHTKKCENYRSELIARCSWNFICIELRPSLECVKSHIYMYLYTCICICRESYQEGMTVQCSHKGPIGSRQRSMFGVFTSSKHCSCTYLTNIPKHFPSPSSHIFALFST